MNDSQPLLSATMQLDANGRCCGRKPITYKTKRNADRPQRFCPRCDRSYDLDKNEQIDNWAWKQRSDGLFVNQLGSGFRAPVRA